MLDQLQVPLLALLQSSPDFQPALDPLLALSRAISTQNPQRSREVLSKLRSIYPDNTELPHLIGNMYP
jgi:spermidine synthase